MEKMKIKVTDTFMKSAEKVFNPNIFYRISNLFYDIKWTVKNLIKYRKIVSKMRPWDYEYIVEMIEFQLSDLCDTIEEYGNEADDSRLPKIKNMRRTIELLNNHIKDNYLDRCGYDDDAIKMKLKGNDVIFEKSPGFENYDEEKIFIDAHELEEKEWKELFEILKYMREWWD